jgi:hypothetical protein
MPTFAKFLASVIASSLLAFSVWPRPWKSLVKFFADSKGIYFPSNSQLVLSISSPSTSEWLFVPWQKHVGVPRDQPIPSSEVVYASYDDSPPHPKKTLKILVDLRSRSEA